MADPVKPAGEKPAGEKPAVEEKPGAQPATPATPAQPPPKVGAGVVRPPTKSAEDDGDEWPPKRRPPTPPGRGVTRPIEEVVSIPVEPGFNQSANESSPVGNLFSEESRPEPEAPAMKKHDERLPYNAQIALWAPRTSYLVGDRRIHAGNMYVCVKDGVSSDVDGPRVARRHIVDGTAVWDWGSTYPTP